VEVAELPAKDGLRAAGLTLDLLTTPLIGLILKALQEGPMRLGELRARLGGPAQTTLRGHLAKLVDFGAVSKQPPGAKEFNLTDMGRELLLVTRILEDWLHSAPNDPIPLGSEAAKGTIKALVGGWQSAMLRALAARPLSLTQLDRLIGSISYPSLERRLSAMRATGLVEAVPDGEGTPYVVTQWGRRGVGPISAAARFERRYLADETPGLKPIDVEAIFMLSAPHARLPTRADGVCQLVAEMQDGKRFLAGVEVTIDRGRIVSCVSRVDPKPRNWAMGGCVGWLDALVECSTERLSIGGDERLVCSVVYGLHELLHDPENKGSPFSKKPKKASA
jgi:DNA-binding HxlR family transcriptional regulator